MKQVASAHFLLLMDYTSPSPRSVSGKTNSQLEPRKRLGGRRSLFGPRCSLCAEHGLHAQSVCSSFTQSPRGLCFFSNSLPRGRDL